MAATRQDLAHDLDGNNVPVDTLPEAVLLADGDLPSMMTLRVLRDVLRLVQAQDLDESRIEEFCSWALHGDPGNPNIQL